MEVRGTVSSEGLADALSELRDTFRSGRTRSAAWRKAQLQAIHDLLRENEDMMLTALQNDLGKHPCEAFRDEVGVILKSLDLSLRGVEKWMAPKKAPIQLIFFPAKGHVLPEPLGLILIFASWNFPISVALDPLIGAISAGNTALLKPSELAPACSSFLAKTIPLYLDSKAIKVIEGGPDTGNQLLQHKWDKIFFTGSQRIGRVVMAAAAKHLTPVIMELGGKCPVILDNLSKPSEFQIAVKRIAAAKWSACSGQACLTIDYMLVEEKSASHLIESLKKTIKSFWGESLTGNNNISRIVNKHHLHRLRNLLQDPAVKESIVYGGSIDEDALFIEPTILLDPPLDAEIMREEIFGPLLPIFTLKRIEESIEFISARPKPLAIYAFTKDESFKNQILSGTSSGGVVFNDVLIQYACDALPFGGVGESGFGRYHGKYSFDAFSHEKAVLRGSFFPEIEPRYPPFTDFRMNFIRLAYRLDYLGLLLLMMGIKTRLNK